ncbi:MAG: HEAT repeat domain-containing protein [Chloroflexi bacterium]|jgi:HEAT repeat protein|nr:HEAT repeat domain-containing protein [Chloroflexota bacterium]
MLSDFSECLENALSQQGILHSGMVAGLSGPTREEIDAFVARLGQDRTARKRELFDLMVRSAEENFELDFADLFRPFLGDPDPAIRRLAIEGLWEDEGVDLVGPMLRFLASDPDTMVRAAAAMSLGRYLWLIVCDVLPARLGQRIEAALRACLNDGQEHVEVRRRAVEAVAHGTEDWVRALIERAYDDDDALMRESAVFAMGRNADSVWTETVLAELTSESPSMRYEAARAAGEMQLRKAVERLVAMIGDPDAEVQEMAIWALGQIGGRRARTVLQRYAASDDEALSVAASEALDEMGFAERPLDLMLHEIPEAHSDEDALDEYDQDDDDDAAFAEDERDEEEDAYWRGETLDLD